MANARDGDNKSRTLPLPAGNGLRVWCKSGAEVTAVQTLSRAPVALSFAKRLECGAFTVAFPQGELEICRGK